MNIVTTSRHYELTPALKDYAEAKVENLTTFFDNIVSAHIVFTLEKYRHFVEITLHVNGKDIVAHDESEDMYASVDRVAEKLERQILKHKGKRYRKKPRGKVAVGRGQSPEPPSSDEATTEDEVIPADPIEFPRLQLEEAVANLNRNGEGFAIFLNNSTDRVNVLFKREDGTIGIIEA